MKIVCKLRHKPASHISIYEGKIGLALKKNRIENLRRKTNFYQHNFNGTLLGIVYSTATIYRIAYGYKLYSYPYINIYILKVHAPRTRSVCHRYFFCFTLGQVRNVSRIRRTVFELNTAGKVRKIDPKYLTKRFRANNITLTSKHRAHCAPVWIIGRRRRRRNTGTGSINIRRSRSGNTIRA